MDVDLMSLDDASAVLGVSSERVRQLVVAGDLSGVRFGNAWAVPRGQVVARAQHAGRRGRPFGPQRAWDEIRDGSVDLQAPGRYRNRCRVERVELSRADLRYLAHSDGAMVSGVEAAIAHGAQLQPMEGSSQLYLREEVLRSAPVAFVAHPLGAILLRLMPENVDRPTGAVIDGRCFAPVAAVALDLLDSDDPRHWIAARALIGL